MGVMSNVLRIPAARPADALAHFAARLPDYFPEALGRQTFYDPPERGFEREIRKRLEYWAKLRKERGGE